MPVQTKNGHKRDFRLPETLRIVSYNIHKCVGQDGEREPGRILDVLKALSPDIALLQEVDRRTGKRASTLERNALRRTGLEIAPLATRPDSHGWHGNAVLIRPNFKVTGARRIKLPVLEPRGAVEVDIKTDKGTKLGVIGVHLSLSERFRRKQIAYLSDYCMDQRKDWPIIVGGDFNHWRQKNLSFTGIDPALEVLTPGATFPSDKPFLPLDRFMLAGDLKVRAVKVVQSTLTRIASDHLPIYLDVTV